MKIHLENLGALRQADFQLGELTIICGGNNTGKTYATYALFGFLKTWRETIPVHIDKEKIGQLLQEGATFIDISDYVRQAEKILTKGCEEYEKRLPNVFAAPEDRFEGTVFRIFLEEEDICPSTEFNRVMRAAKADLFSITKLEDSSELAIALLVEKDDVKLPREAITRVIGNAIKDVLFEQVFPEPFIASDERTGAAIFRKELDFARNRLLEELGESNGDFDPWNLLLKDYRDYALPVKTNVDFMRNLESHSKRVSFIARDHSEILNEFADIVGGEYSVSRSNELHYIPRSKRVKLSMDESSSAVRSLLDIGFYLRHVAQPGDLLMVDEPELNLHPENQRRVARLLCRLVNLGVKVFMTTHSDYIIKELNTLIMLKQNSPRLKQIACKEGYTNQELISAQKVRVYIAEKALKKLNDGKRKVRCLTLTPANTDPELGIEARSFDQTIETMNRIQEEIVWGE